MKFPAAALALVAFVSSIAQAEPSPGAGPSEAAATAKVLTLEEALILARQRNRSLFAERARVAQAQAGVEQAWSALFPTLAVQGRYARNYKEFALDFAGDPLLLQPSNQLDAAVTLTAPLFAPAAYPALDAVKASAGAAEANYDVSETAILVSVAQMFYAASIADEMVAARRFNVTVATATVENAEVRFAAGTVTKVDVDRAQLALVQAEQREREALRGRDHAYRALATLIQRRLPFSVRVTPIPPQWHDERELEAALQRRPEFRALDLSLASAQAQRRAHKWRWAPTLSVFANARQFNYDNFARDRHSWALGGQLDWFIYDGGTRDAERHRAEALIDEISARTEVFRDNVRDELADGKRQLETKLSALQAAERSVALARGTLDLVRVQYEAGNVTQVELLRAQDDLVGAQEALAQARYDVAAADLFLRRAAGTFPPR